MKNKKSALSLVLTAAMLVSVVSAVPMTASAVEEEHTYETKQVHIYRESMDEDETIECRFYDDLPDIPYVDFADYYKTIFDGETVVSKTGDHVFKITMKPDDEQAELNTESDTMKMDNMTTFLSTPEYNVSHVKEQTKKDAPYMELVSVEYDPSVAVPKSLDFYKYDIDIREEDGKVYFPVPTLSDMFAGESYIAVNYNGENIYLNDYDKMGGGNAKDTDTHYSDYFYTHDRSDTMIKFNYNELCFNFDNWYGYPLLHSEFTNRMKEVGLDKALEEMYPDIKKDLLSKDKVDYLWGIICLTNFALADGGHTNFIGSEMSSELQDVPDMMNTLLKKYEEFYVNSDNPYVKKQEEVIKAMIGCSIEKSMKFYDPDETKEFNAGEESMDYSDGDMPTDYDMDDETSYEDYDPSDDYDYEDYDPAEMFADMSDDEILNFMSAYNVSGDTAMISFDSFTVDPDAMRDYFAGKSRLPLWADTFALVNTCLEKASSNPNIKNIVFDVSSNSGGDTLVLMAIVGTVLGKAELVMTDINTQQDIKYTYRVDKNLDGKFDEKDDEVDYSNFNFAVLTSGGSFSCANDFPSIMKDNGVMTIGERSGGGACAFLIRSTADGFTYTISGNYILRNAAGENTDDGVPVDVDLVKFNEDGEKDYSGFFDIDKLGAEMHKFYGTEPVVDVSEQSEESEEVSEVSLPEVSKEESVIGDPPAPKPEINNVKETDEPSDYEVSTDEPLTVPTGDSPAAPILLSVMGAALLTVLAFSRKKEN